MSCGCVCSEVLRCEVGVDSEAAKKLWQDHVYLRGLLLTPERRRLRGELQEISSTPPMPGVR